MQKSLSVFHVFQPFINWGIHKFLGVSSSLEIGCFSGLHNDDKFSE